jgi:hypothetical protein
MSLNKTSMPLDAYKKSAGLDLPAPTLNGGLYVGESFPCNAPWGNIPVVPDSSYLINQNLKSANPPPGAVFQYPSGDRPGNNTAIMPGVEKSKGPFNLLLVNGKDMQNEACDCYKCNFNKYMYL